MYGIITTVNKARLGAVRWQNRARRSRDAVKEELRMKKRNRLTICLVAGVLILAVSATAAFGSVNGYSKYKEAVKALALETDNFTANGTLKMICDGKEVVHVTEGGIPYLAPEAILLFKAKYRRDKDEADFSRALPKLDAAQRRWLGACIARAHPGHAWLEAL